METETQLWLVVLVATFLVVYGLIPLVIHATSSTHKRIVTCPNTGGVAEIELDALPAAAAAPDAGPLMKVKNCSLSLDVRECGQRCIN